MSEKTANTLARLVDVMQRSEPAAAVRTTDAEWDAALADAKRTLPSTSELILAGLELAQLYIAPGSGYPDHRLMMRVSAVCRSVFDMFGIDPKAPDAIPQIQSQISNMVAVQGAQAVAAE